jgi:uncharacterized RDD family membrane protein YckC
MSVQQTDVYASFSRRAGARLIDFFIVMSVCGSLYLTDSLLGFPLRYSTLFDTRAVTSLDSFMYYDFPGVALTFIAIKLLMAYPYFALMESSRLQGTLGKLAMGIKVTDLDGQRLSFGRATGRYFLKAVSTTLLMLGYLVSFSDKRQTWHDYIARALVVRKNFLPPFYGLPQYSSRWQFDLPGLSPKDASQNAELPQTDYICIFCHYRSNEKHLGCPHCGRRFAYGEVGAMKGIQLVNGAIFTMIGGALLLLGTKILVSELHLPYPMAPWWIFAIIFASGGLFTAGGLSSFFGRNWLLGLILVLFAGNLKYSNVDRR